MDTVAGDLADTTIEVEVDMVDMADATAEETTTTGGGHECALEAEVHEGIEIDMEVEVVAAETDQEIVWAVETVIDSCCKVISLVEN